MGSWSYKMFALVLIFGSLSSIVAQNLNCNQFSSLVAEANRLVADQSSYGSYLEFKGIVSPPLIFKVATYLPVRLLRDAKVITTAAQIAQVKYNIPLESFEAFALRCTNSKCRGSKIHPKYRAIDGSGNNENNPQVGASNTNFLRYVGKNYQDGIRAVKRSVVDGSELPNARLIVQEILTKAVQTFPKLPPPTGQLPVPVSLISILLVLFVTHDMHYQQPNQYATQGIGCCTKDDSDILPPELSHPECLPIKVSKNDPFYKKGNIGCLNMVRADLGKNNCGVQVGDILNRATSYLDLSLIYGNMDSELQAIRTYQRGQLRMGRNNLLAVDANGKYLDSMDRFTAIPIACIFPSLFTRNHNDIAGRLAQLNRHWGEETVFQEARRINVAIVQNFLIGLHTVENVFNVKINQTFSYERNFSTSIEFATAYRAGHFYIPDYMVFKKADNSERRILQSDTINKIYLLEDAFTDALRATIDYSVNIGRYSDEMVNRFGKNSAGFGVDLVSIDIQRARDQGVPSFVEVRRKCGLTPEINSMDDFSKILNQTNVNLLKRIYKSHEDVDFYVAGMLETFESVGNPLVGPTFGCVILEQYNNVVGGDIYYFTHPENPYPLTLAQQYAVGNFSYSSMFCTHSDLDAVNQWWPFIYSEKWNPKYKCSNFPPMDISAWKD